MFTSIVPGLVPERLQNGCSDAYSGQIPGLCPEIFKSPKIWVTSGYFATASPKYSIKTKLLAMPRPAYLIKIDILATESSSKWLYCAQRTHQSRQNSYQASSDGRVWLIKSLWIARGVEGSNPNPLKLTHDIQESRIMIKNDKLGGKKSPRFRCQARITR